MTCYRLANGETLRRYCQRRGISYHMMYKRCDRFGWDAQKAVDTGPVKDRETLYVGKYLLTDYCKRYKIPYQKVLGCMSYYDCTPEYAAKHVMEKEKWLKNLPMNKRL